MSIKKGINQLFSMDCFSVIFVLTSFMGVSPLVVATMEPYFKLFHIYAFFVVISDLFGEKRILRNKGRIHLFFLCGSYFVTMLLNRNLLGFSYISNFCYMVETLAFVYSYGENSEKWRRWMRWGVCTLVAIANIVGIWMFYKKFYLYIPNRGYIGIFHSENRLSGLYGNPNVLGMVCLCAIALGLIGVVTEKTIKWKCYYSALCLVNYFTLLLSNSRSQMYSFTLLCGVVTFVCMLKRSRQTRQIFFAAVTAVVCMAAVFGAGKLIQHGASLLDFRYDYYLQNIVPSGGYNVTLNAETIELEENVGIEETIPNGQVESMSEMDDTKETSVRPDTEEKIYENSIKRDETSGFNGRIDLWKTGWFLFKAKPLFGSGMDNHNETLQALRAAELPVSGNFHNVYLEVLVDFGVAGMFCLLSFLGIGIVESFDYLRFNKGSNWETGAVLFGCIAAFMLDGVVDSTLLSSLYPTCVTFWVIMAQTMQFLEKENQMSGHTRIGGLCKIPDGRTSTDRRI